MTKPPLAFLARLGESHNMSFNNDTKRWEGNEEEGDDLDSLHEDIQASYEASVKNGDSAFDENNNIQNLEQHPIMNVKSSPSNPKVEDFDDSLYLSSHANSSGVVAAAGDSRAMTIRNSPKHMSIPRQTLHLGANNGNSSSSSLTAKHNARPHPSSLPPPPAKFAPNHTENMSSDTPMKSFNMSLLNGLDARFQSLADIGRYL